MNKKNNDSNSQDNFFSDSMELFDNIFHDGKEVDQKPAPQKESSAEKPVSPSSDEIPEKQSPASDSQNGAFSDSMELFDNIFHDGTDVDKPARPSKKTPLPPPKKPQQGSGPQKGPVMQKPQQPISPTKKAPPVKPQPSAPTPDKTSPSPPPKKTQKGPEPQTGPPVPPSEKVLTVPLDLSGEKTISRGKARKALNTLLFISSIVVLVIVSMLTGKVLDYKDEKAVIQDMNIRVPPATKKKIPPAISRVPSENLLPEETASLTETLEVSTVEDVSEEKEAPPLSAEPSPPEKPVPDHSELLEAKTLSYPYSIYLGSYGNNATVKKAASDYEEMGLSPYWVELDLGDKGIWFRLFAGYFQKRGDADEFINTEQIPGADSKKTPYANLIGIYTSEEELKIQKEALERLGYSPYVISDTENVYRLYVGVFSQKQRAEEQGVELSLKGIKSQVVER
jgi:hypothetical protein